MRKRLDLEHPVEPEVIQECIRIATQAPAGGGYAQQWRWLVVTDPGKLARLAELYRGTARANTPPDAERVRGEFGAQMARITDSGMHLADRLQDVPVHVIPCVRRSPSQSDIFEVATMFGSILPAVRSFQLALRALGAGHRAHHHASAARTEGCRADCKHIMSGGGRRGRGGLLGTSARRKAPAR